MSNVIEGVSCELYEKGGEDRGEDGEEKVCHLGSRVSPVSASFVVGMQLVCIELVVVE